MENQNYKENTKTKLIFFPFVCRLVHLPVCVRVWFNTTLFFIFRTRGIFPALARLIHIFLVCKRRLCLWSHSSWFHANCLSFFMHSFLCVLYPMLCMFVCTSVQSARVCMCVWFFVRLLVISGIETKSWPIFRISIHIILITSTCFQPDMLPSMELNGWERNINQCDIDKNGTIKANIQHTPVDAANAMQIKCYSERIRWMPIKPNRKAVWRKKIHLSWITQWPIHILYCLQIWSDCH